ncbi:HlyC/CorC family transporter [Nitrosopumilus sp. K4]|uniref:hemolysin family protein n=1 Tax=Nitrosopumilus sp. K4 TaxID=2795383 RepID=UPI001BA739AD|nr:hemolysin family protein [Nitrosopumilus sp. K4]QUC65411.1 HlyC/CorC family transporter [Nitrosopumilus sp. K4]
MVDLWMELAALAVLIGLSGFFSGLEVALVGTRNSKVNQLRKQKEKGAEALYKLKHNPGWMMSSVNLGNNLVNVGSSAFATSVAIRIFGDEGLGIAVGIMTFLILVFGEITPKTYCNANATKIALRFAPVLLIFSYVFWPVVKLFEIITRGMVKLTGSSYHSPPITEDEIKGIVEQGLVDKALEKDESDLVHSALEFDDTVIRTVMTPRTKMFTLPSKMLLFEALPLINQNAHSRVPVFGETNDDIVGFVHVRDILKEMEGEKEMKTLEQIARKPVFVSQEKMVSSLLKEMKGRKTHMAIVIDEHGGVEGLVTLEDLIEEIIGDIEDETDVTPPVDYQSVDRDTIETNGSIEIERVNEIFKANLPEGDDYSTLSGLLHEKLQDIPQEGDKLEIENLRIVVEKVTKNIPEKIRIERMKK